MIAKARHHRRGSVVIMVVGLLTLLAMIGSTLVIVSFLDRREARSIAATVPMKNVAGSVLGRVLVRLTDDLYISDNGTPNDPSDDVLYGAIAAADPDAVAKRIDYPSETVDKHLASFDWQYAGGLYVWKHVSNIPGDLSAPADVPYNDPRLADTDRVAYTVGRRSHWGDSLLWDSGMEDLAGRHLFASTRVVDAGGLLAVNLAHRPAEATHERVMPVTNLSLVPLLRDANDADGVANAVRRARLGPAHAGDTIVDYWTNYALRPNNVGADREYYPFTVADMLAAAWFTTPPRLPTGRLYSVLTWMGDFGTTQEYLTVARHLTVASVGRIGVAPGRATAEQKYKVDLNKADFAALYNAFYNLLVHLDSPDRNTQAAQMAVNVIDFRDADSNITRGKDPEEVGGFVYGVERQPFIVEAAYKREEDGVGNPPISYYAIELYNPFGTAIDIRNWKVKIGADPPVLMPVIAGNAIPAGGRLVIVNDAGIRVDPKSRKVTIDIDLTKDVLILRPSDVGGNTNYVVVDRISKADFVDDDFDRALQPGDPPEFECLRRDDTLANAFYTLPIYNEKKIREDIITGANNLGKTNPAVTLATADVLPCPVYVRNGNFINVADVCRVLVEGPGEDVCLSEGLSNPTSLYNGRLDMGGSIPAAGWGTGIPKLPLGCMPWDFLMVHSPMADGVDNNGDGQTDNAGEDLVFGRVNINTAPHDVLECLPSLASLPKADRDKIVRAIISYRDLDDNDRVLAIIPGSGGGFMYRTSGRDGALGIDNLRTGPGFASPGEIVLPLLARASKDDITAAYKLPNDTYDLAAAPYNESPYNYAVSGGPTDDGLSAADATRVSGDLVKHHVYASWLSNHVAVRSDVYLAYIAVYASTAEGSGTPTADISGTTLSDSTKSWKDDKWLRNRAQEERLHVVFFRDGVVHQIRRITGNDATTLTVATPWSAVTVAPEDHYQILSVKRRYVALIDRSNVRSVRDRPEVLMFAEVR